MKCVVVFTRKKMVYPNFDRGDNFNPKYVWRAYLPVFYVILL